jgi:hypothetical protein
LAHLTACLGAKDEDSVRALGSIEDFNELSTSLRVSAAIESEKAVSGPLEVVTKNVHGLGHLKENQYAVTRGLELGEEPVQELKLAG